LKHKAPRPTPRNCLINWEQPQIEIKTNYKYLGVEITDPDEYKSKYGPSLVSPKELPELVNEFKVPEGEELAASSPNSSKLPTLVGDIHAFGLVDLDENGLSEYRDQIQATDAYNYGTEPHTRSLAELFAKREQEKANKVSAQIQAADKTKTVDGHDFGDNVNQLIDKLAGFVEIERKARSTPQQKRTGSQGGLSAVIYLNPAVATLKSPIEKTNASSEIKKINPQLSVYLPETKEDANKTSTKVEKSDSFDSGFDEHVEKLIDQLAGLVEEYRRSRSANFSPKLNSSTSSSQSGH
jgi:hypothetical protein